jgi:elongation of very long chain fatty acids protein 6
VSAASGPGSSSSPNYPNSYTEYTSSARWFIVMNYCVHSVMYSYYALRAMRFSPPRFIAMIITTLQLAQMIIGCAINVWAHGFLQQAGHASCNISPLNIKLSIAMYFSYFVLFARFFYKTYLSKDGRKSKRNFSPTASASSSLSTSSTTFTPHAQKVKAQ